MAAKKSAKYPYKWSDGTWHSIPDVQHRVNVANRGNKTGVPIVPTNTYDPGLDATSGQVTRGLQNLVGLAPNADTGDYGGTTGRDVGRTSRDLIEQTGYLDTDFETNKARTGEDFNTAIANLQRNYKNLGDTQNAGIRKAGVAGGGAIQQAMDKRTANQALDKAPIDTAYKRATDDLETGHTRGVGALTTTAGRTLDDLKDYAYQQILEAGSTQADIQAAKEAQFQQMYPGAKLPRAVGATRTTAPSITAAPGVAATPGTTGTRKTRKGRRVTYTNSVLGP
jgi:hypothetical protein